MHAAGFEFGVGPLKSRLRSGGIFFLRRERAQVWFCIRIQKQCVSAHQACFLIPAFQTHLV
jgi:hypothetical protein